MIHVIWEFSVIAGREADFERHYASGGTWVQLFKQDPAFIGTQLLKDREIDSRYLTIDRWQSYDAYEAFKRKHHAEYASIDAQMENLTQSERLIGIFGISDRL